MSKILIKYYGMLTVKLNLFVEEISFSADYITVSELVSILKQKHGQVVEDYIKQGYHIFVESDGRNVNILSLDKYETKLKDNDKVLFLYTFAGG